MVRSTKETCKARKRESDGGRVLVWGGYLEKGHQNRDMEEGANRMSGEEASPGNAVSAKALKAGARVVGLGSSEETWWPGRVR